MFKLKLEHEPFMSKSIECDFSKNYLDLSYFANYIKSILQINSEELITLNVRTRNSRCLG